MTLSLMLYTLATGFIIVLLAYYGEDVIKKSHASARVKRIAELTYVIIAATVVAVCAMQLIVYMMELAFRRL